MKFKALQIIRDYTLLGTLVYIYILTVENEFVPYHLLNDSGILAQVALFLDPEYSEAFQFNASWIFLNVLSEKEYVLYSLLSYGE